MRDPRNWVRPAAAVVVGATAGTALVVLRVRLPPPRPQAAVAAACSSSPERTLHDIAEEARRVLPDAVEP